MEVGKSPHIGVPKWRIELTDGWYSVNACIDIGMVRNISTGKIREGTKLVMSGAELLNCDQGFYPLEVGVDFYRNRKRKPVNSLISRRPGTGRRVLEIAHEFNQARTMGHEIRICAVSRTDTHQIT